MADYVVHFIKDENYKRINVTGILTKFSRGAASFDLYEETPPLMTKFIVADNGDVSSFHEDGDLINYVHATVTIDPRNIPGIITNLQKLYDSYIEENYPSAQKSGD